MGFKLGEVGSLLRHHLERRSHNPWGPRLEFPYQPQGSRASLLSWRTNLPLFALQGHRTHNILLGGSCFEYPPCPRAPARTGRAICAFRSFRSRSKSITLLKPSRRPVAPDSQAVLPELGRTPLGEVPAQPCAKSGAAVVGSPGAEMRRIVAMSSPGFARV